jgi:hypothetical protein
MKYKYTPLTYGFISALWLLDYASNSAHKNQVGDLP